MWHSHPFFALLLGPPTLGYEKGWDSDPKAQTKKLDQSKTTWVPSLPIFHMYRKPFASPFCVWMCHFRALEIPDTETQAATGASRFSSFSKQLIRTELEIPPHYNPIMQQHKVGVLAHFGKLQCRELTVGAKGKLSFARSHQSCPAWTTTARKLYMLEVTLRLPALRPLCGIAWSWLEDPALSNKDVAPFGCSWTTEPQDAWTLFLLFPYPRVILIFILCTDIT